jgi:hypothetical protein
MNNRIRLFCLPIGAVGGKKVTVWGWIFRIKIGGIFLDLIGFLPPQYFYEKCCLGLLLT